MPFLVQQARDLEPDFLSLEDFQRLGVQAFQVSLAPEHGEGLQFDPCFFRPHPDKLCEKYPIYIYHLEDDPRDIQFTTLNDYIQDALTEHSPEYAPIIARMEYEEDSDVPPERDPYMHAQDVEEAIESHIKAGRSGPHECFSLVNFRKKDQERWK